MSPKLKEDLIKIVLWINAIIIVSILIIILFYIVSQGLNKINFSFLTEVPRHMGAEGGIYPAIISTIFFTAITLIIAIPLGISTALYFTEYTNNSLWIKIIKFSVDILSAIPSIIFGLFGFILFVVILKPVTGGWSILSGALTAVTMMLPILIKATEEAIKALPKEYKEASLALGASKFQTIVYIILPSALPGIMTGIILGISRIIGETAAFLLTLGGSVLIPSSIFDPARTLAMHIYLTAMEVGAMDVAFGTAAILVFIILILNFLSYLITKRYLGFRY